ncbi:ankyrin repeat domain-containing protein [Pseudoflavitalea sp. X16]|uniref:ankyrin repeat domain-containing protein n=1 Tax=Paraflavitalea devenefica TaxID=2716334 RepID=UPI00141D8D1C|nr:ankyrin repeat domain-containing protein [Paraflavitalea devenefica]NII28518.1 ankyrin repeat domain-containing protein [Paraflavitalea devenefica]
MASVIALVNGNLAKQYSMLYEGNITIARMVQPDELKRETYQHWSQGRGTDVWNMTCASVAGDLPTIQQLLAHDPRLVHCSFEYFKPLHFAVRENQQAAVSYLLAQGADPFNTGGDVLAMARERGYHELASLFESIYRDRYHIAPEGDTIAAAIKAFDTTRVYALLKEQPALLHAADQQGNQPIHWAVLTRQLDLVDYLLTQGADVNAMRPDGARPLDLTRGDYNYRSWYRDLPATGLRTHEVLIGYLIARGADYDISVAAKVGHYERVRALLDRDPGLANRPPAHVGYYSGLPLRCAAAAGHIETVKLLLERGANPNEPEPEIAPWGGALHAAIGGRHFDIVKLLLENGADANAEVESSGNCLSMAKHVNAPQEIIDLIASYARKTRPSDGAAKHDDIEALAAQLQANPQLPVDHLINGFIGKEKRQHIELILRYQPDALHRQLWDPTAWWDTSTLRSAEYTQWLFERGLNPHRRNWLGITLLHRCAAKGDIDIAAICIGYGCDLNAQETGRSATPLGWAAREGKTAMVTWLLQQGADPNLPANEPWARPLAWATRKGHQDIITLLQQHNAHQ